ncbi:MAG: hypothetical protein ABI891_04025 [Acidobacteriota bacterium]
MSNTLWIFVICFILTLLGSLAFLLFTLKYYWGERGTPPLTGEQKHLQKEKELHLRAKQIEHSKKNPWKTRKSSFWDNRKNSAD